MFHPTSIHLNSWCFGVPEIPCCTKIMVAPFAHIRHHNRFLPMFVSWIFRRIIQAIPAFLWPIPFILNKSFVMMVSQGCRFVPYAFSETKPQMVPMDLNIGFQGLALIQGQIYNPVSQKSKSTFKTSQKSPILFLLCRLVQSKDGRARLVDLGAGRHNFLSA